MSECALKCDKPVSPPAGRFDSDVLNPYLDHIMPSIADLLRREIERSDQTLSELARATGVLQPRLWNFVHGDQPSLKLESAEKLLAHFGYVVVKKGEPRATHRQDRRTAHTTRAKRRRA